MKTLRNLIFLLVAASLFSSCLVQDGRGGGRRPHGHGHYGGGHGHW